MYKLIILVKEIGSAVTNKVKSYEEWLSLSQLLIVRISIFNKRRISEVSEMKVSNAYLLTTEDDPEILNYLDVSEKTVAKR